MIGDGSPVSKFGAIPVVALANQKVFEGVTFSWSKRFTLAGVTPVNIIIDTSGVDPDKFVVVLPLGFQAQGGGPIFIDIYSGADADEDGTLWEGFNRDNVAGGTAQTKLRFNPTVNDAGSKLPIEFMIPSDGVPAVASVGGQTSDELVFNALKTKYLLTITNQEATNVNVTIALSLFEV